jgi:hypothetical protein
MKTVFSFLISSFGFEYLNENYEGITSTLSDLSLEPCSTVLLLKLFFEVAPVLNGFRLLIVFR